MRRFFLLGVELLVCLCVSAAGRKEIAVDSIKMKIMCSVEQNHWIYGSADAVTKSTPTECSEFYTDNTITIEQGKLVINKGGEDEQALNISSCTYNEGKVFKDKGFAKTYSFLCKDENENVFQITYQQVTNNGQTYNIITVPRYGDDGCLYGVTTYR